MNCQCPASNANVSDPPCRSYDAPWSITEFQAFLAALVDLTLAFYIDLGFGIRWPLIGCSHTVVGICLLHGAAIVCGIQGRRVLQSTGPGESYVIL